jgi:hypothetical protein
MLLKTMQSSETVQVFVRCHAVRPDEARTDGYVMWVVFQGARDTTMAPQPAQRAGRMNGSWVHRRFACLPPACGGSPRRETAGRSARAGYERRRGVDGLPAEAGIEVEVAATLRLAPSHLGDAHTVEERAPDPFAFAIRRLDELAAQQSASAKPVYLTRGPTPAWREVRWSNGPG